MLAMMMASAGASKQPRPVVNAGVEYGGGYYAGADIIVDGVQYLVIVAPRSQGESSSFLQWKTTASNTTGTNATNNGRANTAAMISAGASLHPAANFCNNLVINGHDDWHLPSQDELEICYRYLKPTAQSNSTTYWPNSNSVPSSGVYTSGNPPQTSVAIFRSGGGEHFDTAHYWSSSQYAAMFSYRLDFNDGRQTQGQKNIGSASVRAVRWEERL